MADFEQAFRAEMEAMKVLGNHAPHSQSVGCLRKLLLSGVLSQKDIRDHPDRFMVAHALISELSNTIGPGFFIRFTVQYNLFAGTVMAAGSEEQVALLDKYQKEGKIGCFGLTEVFAGVNSGLVVNTTCTWNADKQQFLLHSPDEGAYKNWISQGFVADLCAVVADLRIDGQSYGPHAFLMELRRDGKAVDGVHLKDMGIKTIANDLDNARIGFQNVWLPKEALLNRFATIENNKYVQVQKGVRPMDMIGQRLYTGRTVIARSTLVYTRALYRGTRAYTDAKRIWSPKGAEMCLSDVPQLRELYEDAEKELARFDHFLLEVERQLSDCLRESRVPSTELTEAVAVAKVKSVEITSNLCWRLKQEVGSFALMAGSGFEHMDVLQCYKFAEGDSRILMAKITRDRLKAFQKGFEGPAVEAEFCRGIVEAGKKGDPREEFKKMDGLAEAVMKRTLETFVKTAKL